MMRRPLFLLLVTLAFGARADEPMRLSAQQALSIALQQHWDLRQGAIALRAAEADAVQAAAAPNPSLTVSTANINPHSGVGPGPLGSKAVDTIVRIDQLIERGGKRALRSEGAQHRIAAADADRADIRRAMTRDVRQAYVDLQASQERQRVLMEIAALYDQSLAIARKRHQAGDLAQAEVARLQLEVQRARNDLLDAGLQRSTASHALAQLLGLSVPLPRIEASDAWDGALPSADATSALCEARSDVQAARARLAAADSALALARAGRTRDVSVGHPQGTGNSFGFSVQIPLFVRYNNEGEIKAALAAQDAAMLAFERARTQACGEAEQSDVELAASRQRAEAYAGDMLQSARSVADTSEFAFEHGALSVTDVLDTRRIFRMTQLDGIGARAAYLKALAAWRATHLFESP
jgi:cobalt-zinc-cadmium efflux system outer membrane protein